MSNNDQMNQKVADMKQSEMRENKKTVIGYILREKCERNEDCEEGKKEKIKLSGSEKREGQQEKYEERRMV